MHIDFEKWHGNSNDFIVVRTDSVQHELIEPTLIKRAPDLCTRTGSGIGADGIMIVSDDKNNKDLYNLTIINSDGSIASTCGNGLRCAAASVKSSEVSVVEHVEFSVKSGQNAQCRFHLSRTSRDPIIEINMGNAKINHENSWHDSIITYTKELLESKNLSQHINRISTCSLSNNHIILFCDEPKIHMIDIIGPALQKFSGLDGINVHISNPFVPTNSQVDHIKTKLQFEIEDFYNTVTWERGAGKTQACGSGATSVAAAAIDAGDVFGTGWIGILMPGGFLYIKKQEASGEFLLAGPATFVFDGKLEI